jgi:hypothetical protein
LARGGGFREHASATGVLRELQTLALLRNRTQVGSGCEKTRAAARLNTNKPGVTELQREKGKTARLQRKHMATRFERSTGKETRGGGYCGTKTRTDENKTRHGGARTLAHGRRQLKTAEP